MKLLEAHKDLLDFAIGNKIIEQPEKPKQPKEEPKEEPKEKPSGSEITVHKETTVSRTAVMNGESLVERPKRRKLGREVKRRVPQVKDDSIKKIVHSNYVQKAKEDLSVPFCIDQILSNSKEEMTLDQMEKDILKHYPSMENSLKNIRIAANKMVRQGKIDKGIEFGTYKIVFNRKAETIPKKKKEPVKKVGKAKETKKKDGEYTQVINDFGEIEDMKLTVPNCIRLVLGDAEEEMAIKDIISDVVSLFPSMKQKMENGRVVAVNMVKRGQLARGSKRGTYALLKEYEKKKAMQSLKQKKQAEKRAARKEAKQKPKTQLKPQPKIAPKPKVGMSYSGRVLEYLLDIYPKSIKASEVQHLSGKSRAGDLLGKLVARGKVEKISRGVYKGVKQRDRHKKSKENKLTVPDCAKEVLADGWYGPSYIRERIIKNHPEMEDRLKNLNVMLKTMTTRGHLIKDKNNGLYSLPGTESTTEQPDTKPKSKPKKRRGKYGKDKATKPRPQRKQRKKREKPTSISNENRWLKEFETVFKKLEEVDEVNGKMFNGDMDQAHTVLIIMERKGLLKKMRWGYYALA